MSTPVPVSFPTPVPVHLIDGPDRLAIAATVAAVVAAGIALATLIAVFRQIKIANEQLTVANDSLDVANQSLTVANSALDLGRQELDAVKEDLELSRQQMRELSRRPNLELVFKNGTSRARYISDVFGGHYNVELPVSVRNVGERSSRSCQIVFFVPTVLVFNPNKVPLSKEEIAGIDCVRLAITHEGAIYPNDATPTPSPALPLLIKKDAEMNFYYRIYDDFSSYPRDAEYGTLTVQAEWLNPMSPGKGFF